MGQGAFSAAEGYGIEARLLSVPYIVSAAAREINGGILSCYQRGCRNKVLTVIDEFDGKKLPVSQKQDANWVRELNDDFSMSLAAATGNII